MTKCMIACLFLVSVLADVTCQLKANLRITRCRCGNGNREMSSLPTTLPPTITTRYVGTTVLYGTIFPYKTFRQFDSLLGYHFHSVVLSTPSTQSEALIQKAWLLSHVQLLFQKVLFCPCKND